MKLEVGKKYVDGHSNVIEISSVHGNNYVGVDEEYKDAYVYDEKGEMLQCGNWRDNLVKEYQEPRPDVEIVGDLMHSLNIAALFNENVVNGYIDDINIRKLIDEAEQMLTRMKGE